MPHKILFVDDDRYFARLYKASLDKCFEVIVCYDALSAVKCLNDTPDVVCAVIDVMMPPPLGKKAECHDGNTTGLWVVSECQESIVKKRIALFMFTHLGVKFVKDEMLAFLQLESKITEVSSKASILAVDLPARIDAIISRR